MFEQFIVHKYLREFLLIDSIYGYLVHAWSLKKNIVINYTRLGHT